MMTNSEILTFDLGEEDWVIVNLQGQGKSFIFVANLLEIREKGINK